MFTTHALSKLRIVLAVCLMFAVAMPWPALQPGLPRVGPLDTSTATTAATPVQAGGTTRRSRAFAGRSRRVPEIVERAHGEYGDFPHT
jgi:hypothetical protein